MRQYVFQHEPNSSVSQLPAANPSQENGENEGDGNEALGLSKVGIRPTADPQI